MRFLGDCAYWIIFGEEPKGETAREVSGVVQIPAEVMAKCDYGAKNTRK